MKNTFEFIKFHVQPLKEDLSVIDCEYFLVDYTIEHFDVVVAQLMIYSRHKVDEVSFSSGSSPIIIFYLQFMSIQINLSGKNILTNLRERTMSPSIKL